MDEEIFHRAKIYAEHRLERELSPVLYYHSLEHTRDDVVVAADRLALLENLPNQERLLLLTAAWFHDIGMTRQRIDHESASVAIAGEVLSGFGFLPEEVTEVQSMIRATHLPQTPLSPLEQILADADLDVLGRLDFWARNQKLLAEHCAFGDVFTGDEWYRNQLSFMTQHTYFTAAARRLRSTGKQANITVLLEYLRLQQGRLNVRPDGSHLNGEDLGYTI